MSEFGVVIVVTALSYAAGWAIGIPLLVPFLNAALPWWLMARGLVRGDVRRAIALMLVWALTMAVVATWMAAAGWSRTRSGGDLFLRSSYRDEMRTWVRTGEGAESRPSQFLPVHAAHAGVFTAVAVATGGALAMPMGAALVNQMSEYVGALAASSSQPLVVAVLAWHPWAVVRVIAFVILGVLLSAPLVTRIGGGRFRLAQHRSWLLTACGLLVIDVVLKTVLAPTWAVLLRGLVRW